MTVHERMRQAFLFDFFVENSTVTLYGRGFVKFNVAVWCGFRFNETYRPGVYTILSVLLRMMYYSVMKQANAEKKIPSAPIRKSNLRPSDF